MTSVTETTLVADGLDHQLDPRVIPLEQVTGAILLFILAFWSFGGMLVGLVLGDSLSGAPRIGLLLLWAVLMALGAWHAYRWPARAYEHTSYRVDELGMRSAAGSTGARSSACRSRACSTSTSRRGRSIAASGSARW
jgi:hypothetical protein